MDNYNALQDSLAKLRIHAELSSLDPHSSPRGSDQKKQELSDLTSSQPARPELISDQSASLDLSQSQNVNEDSTEGALPVAWKDGYGFRPLSGSSTPQLAKGAQSPLPDPNGLGWPAKSTLTRLYSTPTERAAREEKLAGAVRTLLECIGEDPDREGLKRTPERYAQALLWMTRGYEERLAGTF